MKKQITPEFMSALYAAVKNNKEQDGRTNLAKIGKSIKSAGFDYKEYCPEGLKELFLQLPEKFVVHVDRTNLPPIVYVTAKDEQVSDTSTVLRDQVAVERPLTFESIMEMVDEEEKAIAKMTHLQREKHFRTTVARPSTEKKWCYYMVDEQVILERLATRLAHKETWDLVKSKKPRYCLLRTYLWYTYQKQDKDKQILFVDNYAAFHTGLFSDDYEPIYALLKKEEANDELYTLVDFCFEGIGASGRLLKSLFHPLPERPKYCESLEDYYFYGDREISVNWAHIIISNAYRFPNWYLDKFGLPTYERKDDPVENKLAQSEFTASLRKLIKKNHLLFQDIVDDLDARIFFARKRVMANHNYALPMYYPTTGEMSFILPLSLNDEKKDEADIVLALQKSGNTYEAKTVLTLAMAYSNARLISQPLCSWLDPEKIASAENPDTSANLEEQ